MMDNLNLTYRQYHETFMQNHNGTSLEETMIIQSPIPFVTFLSVCVVSWVKRYEHLFSAFNFNIIQFFVEFICIVILQILIFNLPGYKIYLYYFIYAVSICFVGRILLRCRNETLRNEKRTKALKNMVFTGRRIYITCYRSLVSLSTAICILAVDFTSFPRTLAKTETLGFSLMDLGVGYFVVCSALVGWHNYKSEGKEKERFLYVQLKRNIPLLVLGVLRICFTKNVDYQNHSSEYGVHWNFFLTLMFVRFFSSVALKRISDKYTKFLAATIITIHQLILLSGVQEWVFSDAPRDNLISANREGIVSIIGYTGLYILSVEIRNQLLSKVSNFSKDFKLLIQLIIIIIVLYPTVLLLHYYFPCSRRLVNVTYIVFVVLLSLFLLAIALAFEIIIVIMSSYGNLHTYTNHLPVILQSINFNALPYFLLANMLTGIVNLSIETLRVPNGISICIQTLYMFISCSVISCLYYKNLKIM